MQIQKRSNRTPRGFATAFVIAAIAGSSPSWSQGLTGLCVDNGSAGCQDRFIPFHGLSIDFCEETCTLTNPVDVRDMNGTLFDMTCSADYPSPYEGRTMLLQQSDNGRTRLLMINNRQILQIVRCP